MTTTTWNRYNNNYRYTNKRYNNIYPNNANNNSKRYNKHTK